MELKINIYEKSKIVKTYISNDFMLTTGVCEDILNLLDFDNFTNVKDQTKLGLEVIKIVQKSFTKFKPFLIDIFEGLTEEEFRNTSIKEVAGVVLAIFNHTISELSATGGNSKN